MKSLLVLSIALIGLECAGEPTSSASVSQRPHPNVSNASQKIDLFSIGRVFEEPKPTSQSGTAHAADITNDNPYAPFAFENEAAMQKWAISTLGGAKKTELTYQTRKLVVYFRCYTSGVATSEPVVFVEKGSRWIQLLRGMMCSFDMEATIKQDALILWRLEWQKGKNKKQSF